jgi:hypothetical protein
MYQSTIFGTSVRPRAPPKAAAFPLAPGHQLERAGRDLLAGRATPMMMLRPQPLWQHSSAWRIVVVLPMHSKL